MNSVASSRPDHSPANETLSRRTARMVAFGFVGIVALAPALYVQAIAGGPTFGLSPVALAVLSLIQPTILLAIAALVGARAAPRVGLTSHVHDLGFGRDALRASLSRARRAVLLGLGVGMVIVVLDLVFAPFVGPELAEASSSDSLAVVLASAPMRFLYGGITEELLLRWGLLSALAWIGWRLTGRRAEPGAGVMWTTIVLAAIVFGIGHLPALAAQVTLTPTVVVRTVALNAIGGVAFGWLYWTDSLEAGMIAHASTHVVLLGVAVLSV